MHRLGSLLVFALAGAVLVRAQDVLDYDTYEDGSLLTTEDDEVSLRDLDDPNAWLARLRRQAENIASARPVVNDAYRGWFDTLGDSQVEASNPWPRFFGRDDEGTAETQAPFRFWPGRVEDESIDVRLAAPVAAGEAVLDSLSLSNEIIARTSADAVDATANTAKVIQEQTELMKRALNPDGSFSDGQNNNVNVAVTSPFANSNAFQYPSNGPGSFPDAATVGLIADPASYGTLDGFQSLYGQTGTIPDGFGGVAGRVANAGAQFTTNLYQNTFDADERKSHKSLLGTTLAKLIDLTLEGQANAPVGRYFVDPARVANATNWMDGVKQRAAEKAFGGETDLADPSALFAEGVDLVTALQDDDVEKAARVRSELDLAAVLDGDEY